ncbi:MAG TPA: LysM peptidoglycan-binding domain-containing protein [Spongiibacteraceae bacterium]|nr:LysM peptidoglycan-binding domain-containing protein [Spongiibacteraceae bacterium]
MKKLLLGGLLALLCAFPAFADVLALKPDHPDTYVVKKGDTLWDISNVFLKSPWLWPQLWHVNPQVKNPNLIYPGDVLNLVYIDGKPQLVLSRGAGGDVKLEPEVRSTPISRAIPAIPLEAVNAFLNRGRVVKPGVLEAAPYVLVGKEGHIVTGAGDEIYGRGAFDEKDTSYGIYRKGETFADPDTGEVLGVQALDIGLAKMLSVEKDVATFALNRSTQEIRRGDRLLPEEERAINANFYPSAPDQDIKGKLLAVEGGVSQIGAMSIVVINKGEREGLKEGNLLAIYKAGEIVSDPVTNESVKTPDFRAGLLMVFRVFDKVSYGLVLRAERPLRVNDSVRNP